MLVSRAFDLDRAGLTIHRRMPRPVHDRCPRPHRHPRRPPIACRDGAAGEDRRALRRSISTADLSALPAERTRGAAAADSKRRRSSTRCTCVRSGRATRRCCRRSRQRRQPAAATRARGRARLDYFILNKGPWSRIDDNEPFVPGVPAKPPEANFYPAGATKADVEAWMKSLPDAERRRPPASSRPSAAAQTGRSSAVPYNVEYQGEVALIAGAAPGGGGARRSSRR